MKKTLFILALTLSFLSCKNEEKKVEENVIEKNTKPKISLYVFDGGTIKVNELSIFSQGNMYKGENKVLADPFYVIIHPKGKLIWDAGLGENLVGKDSITTPNGAFTVYRKDSVISQLKSIGLSPKDIDYIALSHTHFDHSGSANKFKASTWLVQEREYEFVNSEALKKQEPDNYLAIKNLTKIKKLNGDFDVFNDGSIIIKSMPGHTPGHQVLFLDLPETGPVLLTGDLYHFQENRKNKGVPSFNTNVEQTLKSMDAFEAFAKEMNAKIIIQHEMNDYKQMVKAPQSIN
jgi:glyoxylase-like metal-dependent hydrolase (beta-lactamase superfamily II)